MNEFLIRWKFNFLVVKWLKVAWLVGLSDMGYDKGFEMGFEMGKLEFCLILLDFIRNFEVGRWLDG